MTIDHAGTALATYDGLANGGQLVRIDWEVMPEYDPSNPNAAGVATSIETYGAMLPYPAHKTGTQPDSLIRAGDQNLLLAAVDADGAALAEPKQNAVITLANGEKWKVADCKPLAPAGVVVLYDITARR